jgi:hypothetical protein
LASSNASLAAKEVIALCVKFPTVHSVAKHLVELAKGNPWNHYHAMMASLAIGDLTSARTQHEALSRVQHNVPWCVELKEKANTIMSKSKDQLAAKELVLAEVAVARSLLMLPKTDHISFSGVVE